MSLTEKLLAGDTRALAAALTLVENYDAKAAALLKEVYPYTGRAHVIGVTGAAGTGKSSLIDRLTAAYRQQQKTVGILAVDPSSVFTGGALLGDRVRMHGHFLDSGVFVRSLATRGGAGGLSAAVRDAVHLFDGAGKDIVIIETIGIGQDQLAIATVAHTVLLVCMPEMGDEIQSIKSGITEVADILVVNKADLPGAPAAVQQLEAAYGASGIPIVATSALTHEGIAALVKRIDARNQTSAGNGSRWRRQVQLCRQELLARLRERVWMQLASKIGDETLDEQAQRLAERRIDPYSAVEALAQQAGV